MRRRRISDLVKNMKSVIAFGNPLLDNTVVIHDNSLIQKYNLEEDGHKEVTENEMHSIYKDISESKPKISPGGCSQNSLRVLQWLLPTDIKTVMFGSVGKDNEATILKDLLHKDGVQTRYIQQENLPTGKTIALVKGASRSLITHIGAAEKFSLNNLLQIQDIHTVLKESDYVYMEGFFLTKRIDTAKYILEFCVKHKRAVIFNICAKYLCDMYPKPLQFFVENAHIVFGNKSEFKAFTKIINLESIEELPNRLFKNSNLSLIVITNGDKPGIIYTRQQTEHFEAHPIKAEDIVDTTGAGDAFVAGFIAGLCKNMSIKDCAKIGCYSAFEIIKQTGCTLPSSQPVIFNSL